MLGIVRRLHVRIGGLQLELVRHWHSEGPGTHQRQVQNHAAFEQILVSHHGGQKCTQMPLLHFSALSYSCEAYQKVFRGPQMALNPLEVD